MTCQENKPITLMAHVAFESKLRSVVGHTCIYDKDNCAAIGRVVVNTDTAAHIFSVGIKCRHCTSQESLSLLLSNFIIDLGHFRSFEIHLPDIKKEEK